MKIFIAILLSPLLFLNAHADVFQKWESDPIYLKVKNACVPGHQALSLSKIQQAFELDLDLEMAQGVKEGILSGIGIRNPLKVNPEVAKQWESTPLYLGLLDCFGNTDRGVMLTRVFVSEFIIAYSSAQAVSFGAATWSGMRLFTLLSGGAIAGVKSVASQMQWLTRFLETYPQLLPRMQLAFKWGNRAMLAGFSIGGVIKGYRQAKAIQEGNEAQKESSVHSEITTLENPDERAFEIEREKAIIPNLQAKLQNCSSPTEQCQKIQSLLESLQKDLARN